MQMRVGCLGPEQCLQESRCLSLGLMLPLVTKGWLFISQSSPLVLAFLRLVSHAAHGGSAPKLPRSRCGTEPQCRFSMAGQDASLW